MNYMNTGKAGESASSGGTFAAYERGTGKFRVITLRSSCRFTEKAMRGHDTGHGSVPRHLLELRANSPVISAFEAEMRTFGSPNEERATTDQGSQMTIGHYPLAG